jgi:starch synthase
MRVGLFTREYPPQVYGGAGIHVEYLSREMAKSIEVEVHCWGPQHSDQGNLHIRGAEPWAEISNGTEGKFKGALEALSLNLTQVKALQGIDVVHTHTFARLESRAARQRLCHEFLDGAHRDPGC